MERVKRSKLKFPCLFGGNEKTVQSCCTSNSTTNHSLFKFHVGKITSKRSNQTKKRSSSIFAKLMGKDVISSTRHISKKQRINLEKEKVSESDISTKNIILLKPSTTESLSSESEVITFGLNDRLIHSLSSISESSLINEAKNKMEETWKMHVNKDFTSEKVPPFSEKEMKHVELDTSTSSSTSVLPSFQDHKMSEPLNRREKLNGNFYRKEDVALKKERSSKRRQLFQRENIFNIKFGKYLTESESSQKSTEAHFEGEDLVKCQPLISEFDGGATKHASCMEALAEKSGGKAPLQLSEHEKEYSESLKKVDHVNQVSDLNVPNIEYASSRIEQFEILDAQLQDLKKQLHLLKIKSLYTSTHPTLTQKRNQKVQQSLVPSTWESSFSSHILQLSDIYETDPDTIHHPTDPRLFYRIEKYYFEGALLSKSDKHLLYDYIEQTFIKISKRMAAGPAKQENEVTLSDLSIEDQVFKVVGEIKKEDTSFLVNNYDKDPEWLEENQINNLGKLLSELVLIDLVLEVISC